MKVITTWSDIPHFETEEEEAAFWIQARIDVRLMNASLLKTDTRESTTITLRFDPRLLARIKRIARSRYLNYQSMIKQWLSERLEKEICSRSASDQFSISNQVPSSRPDASLAALTGILITPTDLRLLPQTPGIAARLARSERFPPVRSNDALQSSCSPIWIFSPSAIANTTPFSTGHAKLLFGAGKKEESRVKSLRCVHLLKFRAC